MPLTGITYWTLMIGFMSGAIAKYLMPKIEHGGIFTTMSLGLIGAVSFEWIGSEIKFYEFGEAQGLIAAFIGAVVFLIVYYFYIRTFGYKFSEKRPKFRRS